MPEQNQTASGPQFSKQLKGQRRRGIVLGLKPKAFGENTQRFRLASFFGEIQSTEKVETGLDGSRYWLWSRRQNNAPSQKQTESAARFHCL